MDYGSHSSGGVAATGAGVTIGGVFIGQLWLIAIAILLIGLGALCIRLGYRRNKQVGDR